RFFSSRRRHTRSKRDWSSDVCSSDLPRDTKHIKKIDLFFKMQANLQQQIVKRLNLFSNDLHSKSESVVRDQQADQNSNNLWLKQIGRASCRERVQTKVVKASLTVKTK